MDPEVALNVLNYHNFSKIHNILEQDPTPDWAASNEYSSTVVPKISVMLTSGG